MEHTTQTSHKHLLHFHLNQNQNSSSRHSIPGPKANQYNTIDMERKQRESGKQNNFRKKKAILTLYETVT